MGPGPSKAILIIADPITGKPAGRLILGNDGVRDRSWFQALAAPKASAAARRKERRTNAIQRCLSEGDRPGQTISWKDFYKKVRVVCAAENDRGFSDGTIKREATLIMSQ